MENPDAEPRVPRVVQPGEVALMLPDEFELRLAASRAAAVQLAIDSDPGALDPAFAFTRATEPSRDAQAC